MTLKLKGKIFGLLLGALFSSNIFGAIFLGILGHFLFDINSIQKFQNYLS